MTTNSTLSRPADAAAPLWRPDDLLAAMRARADGAPLREVTGVSIDTRTLQPGDLFFAIQGEARDGHDFVPAALARGAAAAVVAEDRAAEFRGLGPLCVVPDVLDALVGLGLAARARTGARIAAITGSVGKTGTKEALRAVLAAQGPTHASAASYNNHWGVPLTLARMPSASRFGVFEIGMNHAGEITPLTGMVRPHVAAITTVEPVHLENLGSIEAIADAKAEIFDGLEDGGVAVLPRDNPNFARLLRHAKASRATRIVTFGEHAEADVRLVGLAMKPDMSIVEASVHGSAVAYRLGSPGRHVALNSLCVLAVCAGLGADVTLAALALAHVRPPSGRGERIVLTAPGGDMALYDESYNANPASMRAALSILGQAPLGPGGRRVAVLGDMLELGPEGPQLHAGLAPAIADTGVDVVFCAGPLMKNLFDALPAARRGAWASSASELEPAVVAAVRAGDAITVKGSNGSRTATIVAALKSRFAPPAS